MMKHLKTFESNNRFYKKIDIIQYRAKYLNRLIGLSDKSISIIERYEMKGYIDDDGDGRYFMLEKPLIGYVVELQDEWFIFSFVPNVKATEDNRVYYLCNQLEGLDICLNEFLTKK